MTGGKATFTIADGTVTTYTGGAGVDNVTVTNAATAITKAIDLGAGDDTLTLDGAAVAPTATLKGGDGTDTIAMTGARAEALSANSALADKIDGFEKLSITDKALLPPRSTPLQHGWHQVRGEQGRQCSSSCYWQQADFRI